MNRSEQGREHWLEVAETVARVVEQRRAARSTQMQSQLEGSVSDLAVAFSRGEL
jgi:hypothetical protein